MILAQWRELGLGSEPNIADNGVHASASPFEALSERMNWLGVQAEADAFGQLLLHGGVTTRHIEQWALDPQVTFVSHRQLVTCSLYDALEDLDADRCVTQCQLILGSRSMGLETLDGEAAENLVKNGNTLANKIIDAFDTYTSKYYVEDPNAKGPLWEVTRDLLKEDGGRYGAPKWYGRKLTAAEAQQVLADVAEAQG